MKNKKVLELTEEFNISQTIADLIEDIANGICGSQTLTTGAMLSTKKTKLEYYIPKTKIGEMIIDTISSKLIEIHKTLGWENETEFISTNGKVKLIHWEINDDWCIIQFDNCKERKVNKKYFRTLYDTRIIN